METEKELYKKNKRDEGRVLTGLFLLAGGALWLAARMGAPLPHWMLSWEMFLIILGLYIGVKHRFRNYAWIILVLIGTASLVDDAYPIYNIHNYIWPVVIMIWGLLFILRPKRKHTETNSNQAFDQWDVPVTQSSSDYIDATAIFSGIKRRVLSKSFKGGDITAVMGGAEIDLTQADIQGEVMLDISAVFGGIKLIIPPNWDVQNHATAIFGGVDDKRSSPAVISNAKVLVIDGAAVFGGIEIRSYASSTFS